MKTSFEFVIIGPPFSVNVAKRQSKKHNDWKKNVGRTAKEQWLRDGYPVSDLPMRFPMEVVITTFYTDLRRDVDNVVKPILDGMKNVIYVDDGEIYKLTTQRFDLKVTVEIESPSPLLIKALGSARELVHVMLTWERSEE